MSILINPGSHIGTDGDGWTNTEATARRKAAEWLERMQADGICDVELLPDAVAAGEGRWSFKFLHTITGTVVWLEIDGIDNYDAYCKRHIFSPRVYWNGSSIGEPQIEDFAAEGFEVVKTLRPTGGAA